MLKVITAYKTSRGIFLTMDVAMEKRNREKLYDRGTFVQYEDVKQINVLALYNGVGHVQQYFKLDELTLETTLPNYEPKLVDRSE